MSNRWRMRLALVTLVLLAGALSTAMFVSARRPSPPSPKLSARAQKLAKTNPLVIESTPTMRIVRAVVNDKLFLIIFEKRAGVWFYSTSKAAADLS